MKKYGSIIPIALIVIMLISWYSLFSNSFKTDGEYKKALKSARNQAEMGITKKALIEYRKALDIESTPDVYVEVLKYLKSQNETAKYEDWCEEFVEVYPTEVIAYEYIIDSFKSKGHYEDCFDYLEIVDKRNLKSDKITELKNELAYKYTIDYGGYDDVSVYSNNLCAVKVDKAWGYVNRYGSVKINCMFSKASPYSSLGYAGVTDIEGMPFVIDSDGDKDRISKEKFISFGMIIGDLNVAQKENKKYTYVDADLNSKFGEFDYASTFREGVAAVKNGDSWFLISEKGEKINNNTYLDIKRDEKDICFRNDRLIVSKEKGKYIMIDKDGKQIGKLEFEDAFAFISDQPTAVKIDGKWCFVNTKGERISNKTYYNARPYSNGLAAVCDAGKWGFVDEKEKMVIEPTFNNAKDFNDKGSCFVMEGDRWSLLKLYRLNRKD